MQSRSRLGEMLVKAKVIDEMQLRSALARLEQWGGRIASTLVDMGLADEESLYATLARELKVELVHLGRQARDAQALAKVDVQVAEDKGIFPMALKDNGKTLVLAMADPTDMETLDEVGRKARARVTVVIASETEIRHAIMRHYRNVDPGVVPAGRARKAVQEAGTASSGDDDDFKVTDMSGNTVAKHISQISGAPKGAPASFTVSASDMLDAMFASAPGHAFTDDELKRIEGVRVNQEKSARVVQALQDLLADKGLLKR